MIRRRLGRPFAFAAFVGVLVLAGAGSAAAQEDGGDTTPDVVPTSEAPPPTDSPDTTAAPDTTASPVTASPDSSSGSGSRDVQGSDVVIVGLVGLGGLLVIGSLIALARRSKRRDQAWRQRAVSAYREGVWLHDTLVPGRFGAGLEARSMLAEANRRSGELGATLAALEVDAPGEAARVAVATVRSALEAAMVAASSDVAVRTGRASSSYDRDVEISSATAAQRRGELGSALEVMRAQL